MKTFFNSSYLSGLFSPIILNPEILPTGKLAAFTYDLLVIGGGSGGLACAKRASEHNIDVAVCDFVTPSATLGTKWGLGGTCVNVGCIPKKLMHTAALCGETLHTFAPKYGWVSDQPARCDWGTLRENVLMHIKSLNFGYNVELRQKGVFYHNALASFDPIDTHTVHLRDARGEVKSVTARHIVLAMGGRPTIPLDCPGAREHCITSDDLFRLEKDPGKTCVIGASYVALECAGMLAGIGRSTTVLMRSIPLRGYDRDMSEKVTSFMEEVSGVRFVKGVVPIRVEFDAAQGKRVVYWRSADGSEAHDLFDTVLFAIGRTPETKNMNLPVELHPRSGKVIVDSTLRTSIPHIYALGDILHGGLELTPVAIYQGVQLASNICLSNHREISMDKVASTVFTPLEYGFVGLSEEDAIEKYGEANIEVFHMKFNPLEWTVPHFGRDRCYTKVIVDTTDRVIGFHILAPNAGEITQGIAIAFRAGVTKAMLDETIGIHPTVAEEVTNLSVTKRSGVDPSKGNC
ncbi:thioredoxin reductase [Perkinsela sp. CCAP 1560/4]|nr:thioredoxin reductase [Perkinsela sp. CCAP 1560/4]KNH08560.1 thioredoxin reductase [Perkinsela sp. CCAP 1560/4]|eukprot:KNH04015.1 thioredoxin reductase [Perkinsela sp. CCAP 1560/4]